jgi:NADPH:quinone reductase-like Zn-dependent oxidoreductase
MRAGRIHKFGPPAAIVVNHVPLPTPGKGEALVRVKAAGVGPWDALIREGKSQVASPLPITLGSESSGVIESAGSGVTEFLVGEEVYGATNPNFVGAYAEYAVASVGMVANKPKKLTHTEAASVRVVAVTAWQMLFDYAHARSGQSVLIHGGAGSVGAYAVQLASQARLQVFATASSDDAAYVRGLGAAHALDHRGAPFEDSVPPVDIVIDTVGGEIRERSKTIVKPGGIIVSVVSPFPKPQESSLIRTVFFIVEVTTARLNTIADLIDCGELTTQVGSVLPLEQARAAHEMLAGAPHKRGKIVLTIA